MIGRKKRKVILLNVIVFFLGFNLLLNNGTAIETDINGLSYQGFITPNEEFSLNFRQNIKFRIRVIILI